MSKQQALCPHSIPYDTYFVRATLGLGCLHIDVPKAILRAVDRFSVCVTFTFEFKVIVAI